MATLTFIVIPRFSPLSLQNTEYYHIDPDRCVSNVMDSIECVCCAPMHIQGICVYSVSCAHSPKGDDDSLWPWHVFIYQIALSIQRQSHHLCCYRCGTKDF